MFTMTNALKHIKIKRNDCARIMFQDDFMVIMDTNDELSIWDFTKLRSSHKGTYYWVKEGIMLDLEMILSRPDMLNTMFRINDSLEWITMEQMLAFIKSNLIGYGLR